jgi:hypothetical protein
MSGYAVEVRAPDEEEPRMVVRVRDRAFADRIAVALSDEEMDARVTVGHEAAGTRPKGR